MLIEEYKIKKKKLDKLTKLQNSVLKEFNEIEKEEIQIQGNIDNLKINSEKILLNKKELSSKKDELEKELQEFLGDDFENSLQKLQIEAQKYENLLNNLQNLEKEKNEITNKKAILEKEIINLENDLKTKNNSLQKLKENINQKENVLNELLEKRNYNELKNEYENAVNLKNRLNEQKAAVDAKLKNAQNELNNIKIDEKIDFENIENAIHNLENKRDLLIQEITKNKEAIKRSMELKQKQEILLKEIENKENEFKYYELLYKLIGQKDGGKFKTFVQNLTLRYLINLANNHLKNLTDRYLLSKENENNLEISVIDMYQGNIKRSVSTLSGGESFLVSLSLALGLTDLVSDKIKVDTLFIDEGFGTLDEDTLNTVIETLEKLQNRGKIIGIISHVKELKERISYQIMVIKKPNGFSEIKIIY